MITIISSSNRKNNNTQIIAKELFNIIRSKQLPAQYFSLEDLPENFKLSDIYEYDNSPLQKIIDDYIDSADVLIFVMPEYNGSYPGVLKVFIDAVKPQYFKGKKVGLIGVASGRAGNLRGLDQLTNVFNYMGAHVAPYKLPISGIENLIEENRLVDKETRNVLENFVDRL
ncbi:MAG: hypothetical protein Kow0079_06780 [Vicingaceae bacterium]